MHPPTFVVDIDVQVRRNLISIIRDIDVYILRIPVLTVVLNMYFYHYLQSGHFCHLGNMSDVSGS